MTTRALTSCSSAAAIMLALGDHREASLSSILLYHYSRISMEHHDPVTNDSAEEVSERLKNIDDRMRARLVDRVVSRGGFGGPKSTTGLGDTDRAALRDIRVARSAQARELMSDDDDEAWLDAWLKRTRETSDERKLRNRWSKLYDALLDEDKPISAVLAVKLGLIDRLAEPDPRGWDSPVPGSAARWFEIPEWSAAFPGGRVDEKGLGRHTLILGETGSGKTRSAILPVLAATYRSSRIGVGLARPHRGDRGRPRGCDRRGRVRRARCRGARVRPSRRGGCWARGSRAPGRQWWTGRARPRARRTGREVEASGRTGREGSLPLRATSG